MRQVVGHLVEYLDDKGPGGVLGCYLTGSAVTSGLRADSDIDLVVVTRRSLSQAERKDLLAVLLTISAASSRSGRPVELTCVVRPDVVPWSYPPTCDLLYGEWLRAAVADGAILTRHVSPDLALVLTALRQRFRVLRGPAPTELIDPIPDDDVRRAILDSMPPLLDDLVGDERNVLLTLARMVVTMTTGEIVSKDEAARRIEPSLPTSIRSVVAEAASGYLGLTHDEWSGRQRDVRQAAGLLAARIRTSSATTR